MQRFTRIHQTGQGGATRPHANQSPVFGNGVAMGEPLVLEGDTELRQQIESSLEMVAKERLLEAESKANALTEQARTEAARLLEKANAQAREMITSAQAETDSIRDAAHEEGFKAGFQEGYDDATQQVQQETIELLEGAQVLAEGAYAAERRVLKDFEKNAVRIIETIVRRIVGRELSDSPEALLRMVEHAVESLYLSGKIKVVVSAQIIQDLRQFSDQSKETLDQMSRFDFVADPELEMRQIYIIGQEGSFDVGPEAQIQQMLAPIEQHLKLPRPEATFPETAAMTVTGHLPAGDDSVDNQTSDSQEPQGDSGNQPSHVNDDNDAQDGNASASQDGVNAIPSVNLAPDEWLEVDVTADPFDEGAAS